jgi:RNA polymerase sigma factor (sigma-70 family)
MAPQPHSRSEQGRRAQLLDQLLRSSRAELLRQAHRHSRRPEDADDALGDACVQFLRFYDVESERDPLPWMLVVLKRCAWQIERRRKGRESKRRVSGSEPDIEEWEIAAVEDRSGPAERAERSEEVARTLSLIEELKPDERTALILLGLGFSYSEIAELRGWTWTKVNRCVNEGRAKVRERLRRGE